VEHLESAVKALDVMLTEEQVKAVEAPYRPHGVKGM
jgi:aryl-alcohol dehydrogenase-like predicted oxidoreductase